METKQVKVKRRFNIKPVLPSLISIVIGMFIGVIVLFISNPSNATEAMIRLFKGPFNFGLVKGVGDLLYYSAPILLTGLSVGFAFKTGLFNIGASGQFIVGAFVAVYIAIKWTFIPAPLLWIVALLAAALVGALWAFLVGLLKAWRNVNEVITSIMMNYIGMYMVNFLIDNTLGAWWVSRNPGVTAPYHFEYLRTLDDGTPAAGKFEGWPYKTAEVTSLDPCMGSGHFVCSLFNVFAALRMHEESLTKEEATDRVIAENLHGLEIDPRCTQIAAFNLALTAWKFCGHYKELPEMNLACSGIAPKGKEEDWVKLIGKIERFEDKQRMENGMRAMYKHFQLAPELGSLLDPTTIQADAFTAGFDQLLPVLKKALENERDSEVMERGVMAAGIAKAGELLSKKYWLQITNVPYLSKGKQDKVMADYCTKNYKEAKGDLATVFLDKMLKSNLIEGIACSVIPQNWLFLTTYKKFREKLLKNGTWNFVARLGTKGFQTPMWDFNVMLIAISNFRPNDVHQFTGLDVSEAPNAAAKDKALQSTELKIVNQKEQLKNPDARVVIEVRSNNIPLLLKIANAYIGLHVGGWEAFKRGFWELPKRSTDWSFIQGSVDGVNFFSGLENIAYWPNNGKIHEKNPNARVQGKQAWNKKGFITSPMGSLPFAYYLVDP